MNKEQGFTLIELLAVIAIVGIISTSIYNVYFSGIKVLKFNQDKIDAHQVHRIIIASISPYIKEATGIEFNPSSDDKVIIYFDKKPSPSDDHDYYDGHEYGVNNYKFYCRRKWIDIIDEDENESSYWGNRTSITTEKIKELSFDYNNDNNLLTIYLTLKSEDGEKEYSFSDRFFLRRIAITTP